MESAVFPPNNKQPQETEKLQQQQQQQQQKEAMDSRGVMAVGVSTAINVPENNGDEYNDELEKLRTEVALLKVNTIL